MSERESCAQQLSGLTELDVKSLTLDVGQDSLHSSDAPGLVSDVDSETFSGQFSTFSSEHGEAESDISLCHSVSSLVDLVPSTPTLSASSSMSSSVSSSDELTEPQTRALPLTSQERQEHRLSWDINGSFITTDFA